MVLGSTGIALDTDRQRERGKIDMRRMKKQEEEGEEEEGGRRRKKEEAKANRSWLYSAHIDLISSIERTCSSVIIPKKREKRQNTE
jgi:hypothetical protein